MSSAEANDALDRAALTYAPIGSDSVSTPAGLQSLAELMRRRVLVACLNLALYVTLAVWLANILGASGWGALEALFFACFLIASPWAVLGLVNAALGLWLLRFSPCGLSQAAPFLAAGETRDPIRLRIALAMTVRNEDPDRAIARLRRMEEELSAESDGGRFAYHLLSDTWDARIAAAEERLIGEWRTARPDAADRIHYRRRTDNRGFKAGNLFEFCTRCVDDYDALIALDADSFMRSGTIIRMARIAQAHPRIGILQSLVVGAPSSSAFARLFQSGMRMGMRSYTMGAAWWAGDCGPFWGHNALVRIRPFLDYCKLPVLPGRPPFGGQILSHDQVEATLMRRAGYEVRVLPIETGSYEDNPPDMVEFSRRDMRWCQGNMQYFGLLRTPGLEPVSRFQLVWAIAMFLALPASQAMLALAALRSLDPPVNFPVGSAIAFLVVYLLIGLAPKLAGLADIMLGGEIPRYGGAKRFAIGAVLEIVASYLLSAAIGFRTALFVIGLPFGKSLGWTSQRRDHDAVSWRDAIAAFWPATLFGVATTAVLAIGAPGALPYAAPFVAGLVLAIPFAKLTAEPALGAWFVRKGLCAAPEEISAP